MYGSFDAGDIESMPFIEALGQFSYRVGEKSMEILSWKLFAILTCVLTSLLINSMDLSSQYGFTPGPENFCLVHVSLVPVLNVVGEQVYNFSIFSLFPVTSLYK